MFVETLDKCFENVCELDLIFHMDKVHFILNELVMGGMVLETNMNEILTRIEEQNKIEREEVRGIIIYTGHREIGLVLAGHYFLKTYLVLAVKSE